MSAAEPMAAPVAPSPLHTDRLALKVFLERDVAIDPAALIAVFHRYIQEHALDGLLIDVAVYDHVAGGPGVMLVAHEGNYAIDLGPPGPGLVLQLKRGVPTEARARFEWLVRATLRAAAALEAEPTLGFRFDRTRLLVRVLDRLVAPPGAATFERAAPELATWVGELLGEATLAPETGRPRAPFAVELRFDAPFELRR